MKVPSYFHLLLLVFIKAYLITIEDRSKVYLLFPALSILKHLHINRRKVIELIRKGYEIAKKQQSL